MIKKINKVIRPVLREVVFGLEDGMVSTLGTITGVAIGSNESSLVLLSGCVIVAVESFSMGIGSYLSNQSEHEMREQILKEEKDQIKKYPRAEQTELVEIYIKDGWPKDLSRKMSQAAFKNKILFFREMAHHEHNIIPNRDVFPFKNGMYMFFSYVFGGIIPLLSYLFFPIYIAMPLSIIITLISLFSLGGYVGKFIKVNWLKSGIRMSILAGIAITIGIIVGLIFRS